MVEPLTGIALKTSKIAKAGKEVAGVANKAIKTVKRLEDVRQNMEAAENNEAMAPALTSIAGTLSKAPRGLGTTVQYASATNFPALSKLAEEGISSAAAISETLNIDVLVDSVDAMHEVVERCENTTVCRVLVPYIAKVGELEQFLYRTLDDEFGLVLTAKKVDYLVNSKYVPGLLEAAPMVGSLARVNHKFQLGEALTRRDLIDACNDGALIVELSATALGRPEIAAGANWVRTALDGYEKVEPFLNDVKPIMIRAGEAFDLTNVENSVVKGWVEGNDVAIGERITPGDFSRRFEAITPHLEEYFRDCCARYPDMNALYEDKLKKLDEARKLGPGAVQSVMTQAKRNLAGRFAEQLMTDALAPFFDGAIQNEVAVKVGERGSRVDRLFEGAKSPIVGKGGLFVPKGGSFAVESKAGSAAYIKSQQSHMNFQAKGGGIAADGNAIFTSKNINGLANEVERKLRDSLRDNAILYKLHPAKADLDRAVLSGLEKAIELGNAGKMGEQ